MPSRNVSRFLATAYYWVALLAYHGPLVRALGGTAELHVLAALAFPTALLARRRFAPAIGLLGTTLVFAVALALMQLRTASPAALFAVWDAPTLPVYAFLVLLAPGLFLVAELDSATLPHELAYFGHPKWLQPVNIVVTTRERARQRLEIIREACVVRGIHMATPRQHLMRPFLWLIPLTVSTICEAAYASAYRDMLGADHLFIPTRQRPVVLTRPQQVLIWLLAPLAFAGVVLTSFQ